MAMLASKSPFTPSLGSGVSAMTPSMPSGGYPTIRKAATMPVSSQSFASPTESEFSESDGPDSVKNWDEDQVCDYLRSVKCGDYEMIFRRNHINGENLLEMDKEVLREMGIDKVGDRVRLFLGIKKLRTRAYANQKKRNRVRIASSCFLFCLSGSHGRQRAHRDE
jgi:mitogen-activated protein kinase kinase kinase